MTSFDTIFKHLDADAGPLAFPLLTTPNDTVKFFDLAAAPHALWAGTTGSGKSVSLNIALATLIKRNTGQVIFDMIDPKRVELSIYRNVEHVRSVTTDMDDAAQIVEALAEEMDERYSLLEREGVRKLSDYNAKTGQNLPYRVLVVDELADLMDTHKSQVLPALVRIGQLGRAAGFHMMLATQRPAADTIPKKLLANVPARIALLCQSHTESRLILGEKGAEDLNGHGDMLVQVPGERGLSRGQGPFLSDEELAQIVLDHTDPELMDPTDEELDADEDEDWEDDGVEVPEEAVAEALNAPMPTATAPSVESVEAMSRALAELMQSRQSTGQEAELYERVIALERESASLRHIAAEAEDNLRERDSKIERLEREVEYERKRADIIKADAERADAVAREQSDEVKKAAANVEMRRTIIMASYGGVTWGLMALAAMFVILPPIVPHAGLAMASFVGGILVFVLTLAARRGFKMRSADGT